MWSVAVFLVSDTVFQRYGSLGELIPYATLPGSGYFDCRFLNMTVSEFIPTLILQDNQTLEWLSFCWINQHTSDWLLVSSLRSVWQNHDWDGKTCKDYRERFRRFQQLTESTLYLWVWRDGLLLEHKMACGLLGYKMDFSASVVAIIYQS